MNRNYQNVTAHKMVAHMAEEMAQEIFEELAKGNNFFKQHQDRAHFIRHCAPSLRESARVMLAEMLTRHDISEAEKTTIYEALILDKALPLGGTSITERVH